MKYLLSCVFVLMWLLNPLSSFAGMSGKCEACGDSAKSSCCGKESSCGSKEASCCEKESSCCGKEGSDTGTGKSSCCGENDYSEYVHWKRHWSWSIGPRYLNQTNRNADLAFTSNGFGLPKDDLLGVNFELMRRAKSGFVFGIDFSWWGTQRSVSKFEAEMRTSVVSLRAGYDFLDGEGPGSLIAAADVGAAFTELEIFSGNRDGQLNSVALHLEPSLTYFHRLSRRIRLGARASYVATVGDGSSYKGDNLAVSKIAPKGVSAALLLNIGYFGAK